MKQSLKPLDIKAIRTKLTRSNVKYAKAYPGESSARQPVHTVYGGAQIFNSDTASKMGESALKMMKVYAPNAKAAAKALHLTVEHDLMETVYARVMDKLKKEAVEDFRIDFEDGYGNRPNAEEDKDAERTALELVKGMKNKSLPPFIGIRIKPFNEERVVRSMRTADIFLSTVLSNTKGKLPENFVVTLPKVQTVEQAIAFEQMLTVIEHKNKLKKGYLKCELMIETPQSILDITGVSPMRSFVEAMNGRCTGAHFGTYDYTAGCNVTAICQTMANPVCGFAKHVMQVSLAGMPIFLSDGATNVMPVGPHKGDDLSAAQKHENDQVVHRAWRLSYKHIMHSLETGYYQGWDLHPAQLPVRYFAMYLFFLESYGQAAARLGSFIEKAAKATLLGDVFDDAATGQGLLNYFIRGVSCGAITEEEALSTGVTLEEFRSRSFLKILENRKLV